MFGTDIELVQKREGTVLHWYKDSLGKETGGTGHLRRKGDPDTFDQTIAAKWLESDIQGARKAAQKQLDQLPIQTASLAVVLVSVNFQFGNDFDTQFPATFALLKKGDYQGAIAGLQPQRWNKQTPIRVKDFTMALQEAILLDRQYRDLGL